MREVQYMVAGIDPQAVTQVGRRAGPVRGMHHARSLGDRGGLSGGGPRLPSHDGDIPPRQVHTCCNHDSCRGLPPRTHTIPASALVSLATSIPGGVVRC